MESGKITIDAVNLLTSLGFSIAIEGNDVKFIAETLSTIDFTSIDLTKKNDELITLLHLCQNIIGYLLKCEQEENGKNTSSSQVEKLQVQNKKLRHMLQLHQKSFLASLLNTSSCSHCPKSFIDEGHLETHFQRRHEQQGFDSETFPLLERINDYKGLNIVKNERLDQLKDEIDALKDKLNLAQNEIKHEQEERQKLEQAISQQLDHKIDQIEKKIYDFFHFSSGEEQVSRGNGNFSTRNESSLVWAQIAVLKQLASEVYSLKENISRNQSTQLQSIKVEKQPKSTSYQEVESFVKQKLDELNIQSDSTGISETTLETALKHIQEKRQANEPNDNLQISEQTSTLIPCEISRPVPTVRRSIGPTSILKKSKSTDQVDPSKEQKKIQWSN